MSDPDADLRVQAPPETLARLAEVFEAGKDADTLARELDVHPPDDRDGWILTYETGPNGEDLGLTWYQPADEPLTMLDYLVLPPLTQVGVLLSQGLP